jgi:ABC-type transport auxiliary lipoprotein component
MRRWRSAVLLAAVALTGAGCALLTKSDSVYVRYFAPEARPGSASGMAAIPRVAASNLSVRLGRVNALSYLKDRIAFRDAEYEVGFHDLWQWTEKPESYLRRGMERALFEQHAVHQIISGSGPTLELELDAFDELRSPRHMARVQVTWLLYDDETVLVQNTVTVDHAIPGGGDAKDPKPLVSAMSDALGDVIGDIVARVMPALSRVDAEGEAGAPPAAGRPGIDAERTTPGRAER